MKPIRFIVLVTAFVSTNSLASDEFTNRVQGDLGLFANVTSSPVKGIGNNASLLPYAYFEFGRVYGRIDTFGIKTVPFGYGHLELVGRIKQDGYELAGIAKRDNSVPIGLGTFQLTPVGGLFLYALHDASRSRGNIYEAVYVAKFSAGRVTVYPQIGVEHVTENYARYYYGVSESDAARSGYAPYAPTPSTNGMVSAMCEVPIGNSWFTNIYLRRKWLGSAITGSPLINAPFEDSGFMSIAYRFK